MSNRLFQGLVHQMRDTIDATVGVVDDTATIIACSDLTKVGTTNEFVSLDLSDVHDIFIRDGYTYTKVHSTLTSFISSLWFAIFCSQILYASFSLSLFSSR